MSSHLEKQTHINQDNKSTNSNQTLLPNKIQVYGKHSLLPDLVQSPNIWSANNESKKSLIPLLERSQGKISPYLIVVGDRRRFLFFFFFF